MPKQVKVNTVSLREAIEALEFKAKMECEEEGVPGAANAVEDHDDWKTAQRLRKLLLEELPTKKNQYADRDPEELGAHYLKHVSAMTSENLFEKSHVAAELAVRDEIIEDLVEVIKDQYGGNYQSVNDVVDRAAPFCTNKCL